MDIKIQGRDFRVACAPEEVSSLQAAAELLNVRMGDIARATKSTGERLAVMTALNLANDLNAARRGPADATEIAIDDEESRRRIKNIEARLDAMLAPQEKLF
ncbi:MAG: cell division protein ZapA [Rhodocyclaceae bacterium]|nr:cell division protein ZapA [Rhodocyclaceae bacterium]